jgi:hypothetical protein
MRRITVVAPRVSQCSATLVGALHSTGSGGPISDTMRGPPSAETVLVVAGTETRGRLLGVDVDAAIEVVEMALDVDVDAREGRFGGLLLLQAVGTATATIIVSEATRGRRTPRS